MGLAKSSHNVTEGNDRSEAVVSVRFAADEVALLRRLASAQHMPLSTVIRRAALAASTSPAIVGLRTEMNQGAAGSGWTLYDSFSSQFVAGSTLPAAAAAMNYRVPSANTI
jgi:hypothetical protein